MYTLPSLSLSLSLYLALSLLLTVTHSAPVNDHNNNHHKHSVWNISNFANLVTFGDSYTDESRLAYFVNHNGTAPPTGLVLPESFSTASGGRTWPRYVVQYTGRTVGGGDGGRWNPRLDLYDYAVSGAVCSNEITPRYLSSINGNFPSVLEYEISAFKADAQATRLDNNASTSTSNSSSSSNSNNNGNTTVQPFYTAPRTSKNTVYALWIGTNDLGQGAFLTNSQIPGKTLTDYTNCNFAVFDQLYSQGARTFVLMNTIPLELTPLYANQTLHGVDANNSTYWPTKPSSPQEQSNLADKIHQYTTTVNTVFKYQLLDHSTRKRYPGASFALFDMHSLFSDIYFHPSEYFNGTIGSPQVEVAERTCNGNGTDCRLQYEGRSPDSFMWYDSLHPSEQTDRVVAREFVNVISGTSEYASYYHYRW